MDYDVLDAPSFGGRITGTYPPVSPSRNLVETEDEYGEPVIRRLPSVSPRPSHYVVYRSTEEEVAWQIYAGPFNAETAMEIAEALQLKANPKRRA